MKNIFKYICFLCFLYGLWNFVLGYFSFLLFLMICLVIFICLLLSLVPMKETDVSVKNRQTDCHRGENMKIQFYRECSLPIQCGKIVIDYQIIDCFSNLVSQEQITMNDNYMEIEIPCQHCGYYMIEIKKIQCFDLLQCFHYTKTVNEQIGFYVLPHYFDVDTEIENIYQFDEQGVSYLPHQKGEDYSEIFEVRNYHEGDELKHIHWKMSLKFQELLVKIGSQPVQQKFVLGMEYKDNNEFYDLQFDYFYSVCMAFIKRNMTFEIVTSLQDQVIHTQTVTHLYELMDVIKWLMKNPITQLNHSLIPGSFCQIQGQKMEVYHS